MIEFSMDLSKKLYDADALKQKVNVRLSMTKGTIPHSDLGMVPFLFSYNDGSIAVRDALKGLGVTSISFDKSNSRVKVMNVEIDISKGAE